MKYIVHSYYTTILKCQCIFNRILRIKIFLTNSITTSDIQACKQMLDIDKKTFVCSCTNIRRCTHKYRICCEVSTCIDTHLFVFFNNCKWLGCQGTTYTIVFYTVLKKTFSSRMIGREENSAFLYDIYRMLVFFSSFFRVLTTG